VAPVLFCSACGAGLASPPPVTCASCGTSHWDNPKPCANAVVVEDGKVLLVRRAKAPWAGAWSTPGGFSESGEHPIETVEREVLEETGLRVAVSGYIGVWVDDYADPPVPPGSDVINVAYYAATLLDDASPTLDGAEVSEIGWFGWDELPAELAPPGTLAAVLAAARRTTEIHDRPTTARTPPG
jgi:ADP-ribose pyrophosphatase YjhB (NUDIX family)